MRTQGVRRHILARGEGFRLKLSRDFESVHKAEEAEVAEVTDGEIEAQIHKETDFLIFHHGGKPILIERNVLGC